jgi:Uma2 family endonuclease
METIVLRDRITSNMTDEEFLWFCQENKDLRIERNSRLEILIMSPVTTISGNHSGEVCRQLANWSIQNNTGVSFDSSTGFTLPDRSVFSPDASWVSNKKWDALSQEDKDSFDQLLREFLI